MSSKKIFFPPACNKRDVYPNAFIQDLINNVLISVINLNKITFFLPDFSSSFIFVFVGLIVLQLINSASATPCSRCTKFFVSQHFSSGNGVAIP